MGVSVGYADDELIYMILQKSDDALAIFLNKYERIYKAIVYSFEYHFKDTSQIHDLHMKCRLILYQAVFSYREDKGAKFSYYFKMLVEQAIINEIRKMKCTLRHHDYEAVSLDMYVNESKSVYLSDMMENNQPEYNPTWYLHYQQMKKEIEEVKKGLNEFEQIIWEYRIKGYSYKQIADMMNVSVKKVDNTIQKIKRNTGYLIEKIRSY